MLLSEVYHSGIFEDCHHRMQSMLPWFYCVTIMKLSCSSGLSGLAGNVALSPSVHILRPYLARTTGTDACINYEHSCHDSSCEEMNASHKWCQRTQQLSITRPNVLHFFLSTISCHGVHILDSHENSRHYLLPGSYV